MKPTPKRQATENPSYERYPTHLKALEEIEREGIPGLVEVLREEGLDTVRHTLRDTIGWYEDYEPSGERSTASEEQKRTRWEMQVRIEKILCTVLHEAHERQIEKTMEALGEGSGSFYESRLG